MECSCEDHQSLERDHFGYRLTHALKLRSPTHTSRWCCTWRLRQDHWTTGKEEEMRSREGGAESKGRDRKGERTLSQGERIT